MITIYTVGHSNHESDEFLLLLQRHGIEILVDVRSSPYSRYVPQANRESLASSLQAAGIEYRWLGDRLGGKPKEVSARVVDYDAMRLNPSFQQGIADLLALAAEQRAAIMCAEADHRQCHRYMLITPVLLDREVHVLHIQPDGSLVDENKEPRQLALF